MFVAATFFCSGCGTPVPPIAASHNPGPSTDESKLQAWRDAEAIAALDPARLTVIGTGDSMRPIYGESTILVLQKTSFDQLAAGMTVAYRNHAGRVVVHRLLKRETANGWRVIGLNNETEDRERVTMFNLLGVVYASFAHDSVE